MAQQQLDVSTQHKLDIATLDAEHNVKQIEIDHELHHSAVRVFTDRWKRSRGRWKGVTAGSRYGAAYCHIAMK